MSGGTETMMKWIGIGAFILVTLFFGFPYFLDPARAAHFDEPHWLIGLSTYASLIWIGILIGRMI